MDLFEETLAEVEGLDGERYVLRRNRRGPRSWPPRALLRAMTKVPLMHERSSGPRGHATTLN
jgi:hypothetical protein